MPRYRVISPLQRDGKRHEIGATVELDAKAAEGLLAHTIEGPLKAAPAKKTAPKQKAAPKPVGKT